MQFCRCRFLSARAQKGEYIEAGSRGRGGTTRQNDKAVLGFSSRPSAVIMYISFNRDLDNGMVEAKALGLVSAQRCPRPTLLL